MSTARKSIGPVGAAAASAKGNALSNCFLGGLGYVFGPLVGTFVLYFGWDFLFRTGEYQLLIFSSILIVLMLVLPNGLLSIRLVRRPYRPASQPGNKGLLPVEDQRPASAGVERG